MPCHPTQYATISVPLCEALVREGVSICGAETGSNLAKSRGTGTMMGGPTKDIIGRLVAFVGRAGDSCKQ